MILDLREFESFPADACLEADRGEIKVNRDDVIEVMTAKAELSLQHSGEEYFVQGTVASDVRMECARCLSEYTQDCSGKTDFIIRSEIAADSRQAKVADDEDYVYLDGDDLRVDVTDIVRQAIVLAMPMKPLCSVDCQGLCDKCGANRNETSCDCNQDRIDPRWEGLSGLTQK